MTIDANTGQVLHSDSGDELRHPASLTKMMTLYLTFEAIEAGVLSMSSRIPISDAAASAPPSKLNLDPGDTISVADAIRALITKSANDVAIALAEKIGGSERGFVKLMNQRASDLGMKKTNFENASGLPDADQVTTARDMIMLGLRLQDHYPQHYRLFSSRTFNYAGKTLRNHNTLLNSFQGADGIKTGYTRMSGFNLVSSVRRGGRHVVGAVFGGKSAATRNGEMRVLLSKALTEASDVKTRNPPPLLIAKLKAPPKPAARPVKKPLEQSVEIAAAPRPAPKPFAPSKAEVAAATAAKTALAVLPAAPVAEAAVATPIEVYKVKRVAVAPRTKPAAPVDPDKTTDMTMEDLIAAATASPPADNAAPELSPEPRFVTASASASPADDIAQRISTAAVAEPNPAPEQETVIGKLIAATAPMPEGSAAAMLGAATLIPAADVAEAPVEVASNEPLTEPAVVESEPMMLPGLAPSTLADQAASLNAVRRNTNAPAAAPAPASAEGYAIQIGAYGSSDEAKWALAAAKTRAAASLAGVKQVTQPVQKSGRTMYRARFAGFDGSAAAASACTNLKRQQIDCFVMAAGK